MHSTKGESVNLQVLTNTNEVLANCLLKAFIVLVEAYMFLENFSLGCSTKDAETEKKRQKYLVSKRSLYSAVAKFVSEHSQHPSSVEVSSFAISSFSLLAHSVIHPQ